MKETWAKKGLVISVILLIIGVAVALECTPESRQ